jgi:transposase
MGYSGPVAREHSSGNRVKRGVITKTGNNRLRRVLVKAAWAYQHRPNVTSFLLRRQKNLALSDEVKKVSWKANVCTNATRRLRSATRTKIRS